MLNDEEFAEFVQTRGPALLRTACFLSGSPQEGEDLLQQTLVNAYASFRRIREPAALEGYVRTTMVRACISAGRKPWRKREWSTDAVPETPRFDHQSAVDDRDQLWPLLRQLPPQQRAVMVLRYYEDLSEAEIARQLGCSTGSVKRHASRALDKLRQSFANPTANPQEGEVR